MVVVVMVMVTELRLKTSYKGVKFFFVFLGPNPRHMDIPRLGVE